MDKKEKYQLVLNQIKSLCEDESDLISNLSNAMAVIHNEFSYHWTGIYFVRDKQLVLGPFQGPLACTRIPYGKGVCGSAWAQKETLLVDDVHAFPGHIACSALSNSEIVTPILKEGEVVAVIDIDSVNFSQFDTIDREYLENIAEILSRFF